MLSLRKPSPQTIQRFLDAHAHSEFSYVALGATAGKPPEEYTLDHTRAKVGDGEAAYRTAKAALEQWEHLSVGWAEPVYGDAPIQTGQTVAIIARVAGIWWRNACRVVYVIDEREPVPRFGFAYGTLADHVESGEERFLVEWDRSDDSVWYDVLAFSRPRHLLARLGYPCVRLYQRRFARDSVAAMRRAVARSGS